MSKLERDHLRLTASRENYGRPPRLEQFQCGMCGTWFLMRASLNRHKVGELPAFIAESKAKNEAYVASRQVHTAIYQPVSKEELAEREDALERGELLKLVE